ncbi:S-adenosyl-L-methionine-dependent methyltransferase [Daldinia caldariorum]|uniref:S-adenosyl-L-methionine-dependent methyltransferase n=1 Tax=Daldinia caldariorum TaxID=326644 RepID=UPI002007B10D|nr:S-adenosyl-L-methionine-dependent methyltransferase [Daldinia caldariorum]KAI1471878.1 S-adenosyl-L-methionine-dependent methyltransferase [Daldinia caldariorum]
MASVDQAISRLNEINTESFDSESERLRLSNAILSTLRKVQSPWDIASTHGFVNPTIAASVKTLIDARVFTKWVEQGSKPLRVDEFAELTGVDAVLLSRLLRHIAAQHLITFVGEDTYASTPWALSLGTDPAIASIYGTFYHELIAPLALSLPSYLGGTGFKNPNDEKDGNFQRVHGKGSSLYGFVGASPLRSKEFADVMKCHARGSILPWTEVYDTYQIVMGAKMDRPLVVDVGGSKGHDLEKFHQKYPDIPKGSLVLQDIPEVVEGLTVDPAISVCPHDFFTPQPVKGARAYYLHIVLHNWPDHKAAEILKNIADAMEPGYSKILIYEDVISMRELSIQVTFPDMTMMALCSSAERFENDWHRLVGGVKGLKIVKFWHRPHTIGGIVEVDRI